jgi:S1-C subfamily serine protease
MRVTVSILLAVVFAARTAFATEPALSPATVTPPASPEPKAVALTRVVVELPVGKVFIHVQRGMFCTTATTQTWSGARTEYGVAAVQGAFRQEMKNAGLKTDDSSENLFEPQGTATAAEYSLGGVIRDADVTSCSPNTAEAAKAKGQETMAIDWQLFSRVQNQVVGRFQTSATFELKDPTPGGIALLNNGVFAANVRALAAMPAFRDAVSGRYAAPPGSGEAPIVLNGAAAAAGQPIENAAKSVVVVSTTASQGSAFLVSRDGYLLSDAHVVGEAKTVRLRWSDGVETSGEVVRVSKRLDVALIKADARGQSPLPLRRQHPTVGETVYAIGSPLGQKYQGTVTRGVVSAERTIDEHHYIQSDVTVQMGSSGGPLLDSSGHVVGIAEKLAGLLPISAGLNFFTPMDEAMDALKLEPH